MKAARTVSNEYLHQQHVVIWVIDQDNIHVHVANDDDVLVEVD